MRAIKKTTINTKNKNITNNMHKKKQQQKLLIRNSLILVEKMMQQVKSYKKEKFTLVKNVEIVIIGENF